MPTLFISYGRETVDPAPLVNALRAAHYRVWIDREDIHTGQNWRAVIDQGIDTCDAVILCLTPKACRSAYVRYEIERAGEKPIFPVKLADVTEADLDALGVADIQFTDFTGPDFDAALTRLLDDMRRAGLRVTRHDVRAHRGTDAAQRHHRYLRDVIARVGGLSLSNIAPDARENIALERVYVDSPTEMKLSVRVQDWRVVAHGFTTWVAETDQGERGVFQSAERLRTIRKQIPGMTGIRFESMTPPEELALEPQPFSKIVDDIDIEITAYRREHTRLDPADITRFNPWANGVKQDLYTLHLRHIAAAAPKLVILGQPGGGKSTFVRHLALSLAAAGLPDAPREVPLDDTWPHGPLTPVYVELRRFVASDHFPPREMPTADDLWTYIINEQIEDADYAAELRLDLEEGQAVLVLDGLDEVPYAEGKLEQRREQLKELAASIRDTFGQSRLIVTSRPYAYEGWKLDEGWDDAERFHVTVIAPYDREHRVALATNLYRVTGMDDVAADEAAKNLENQLLARKIADDLKDRPLFLTLMATVYLRNRELPTRRGALIRESILLLLARYTASKPGARSLADILGLPRDDAQQLLLQKLGALAYEVHGRTDDAEGTPEIAEALLYDYLRPLGRRTAADLIPYLSENAGVLVSPGQDGERDVFQFAHRTFQEYLAADYLVRVSVEQDNYVAIRTLVQRKPQTWRDPCLLAGDVLADTERRGELWNLVEDLLDKPVVPDDVPDAERPLWWSVWLAGGVAVQQDLHKISDLRRGEAAVRDMLVEWLVALVNTPEALPPVQRADCGIVLSHFGDPRPGVGVSGEGLPDIAWCGVGDFQIAKYPVTMRQFDAFLKAEHGFKQDRWWDGMPETVKIRGRTVRVRQNHRQENAYANHPRDNVSWYQAVAFCRWLTAQYRAAGLIGTDETITLPTDRQWTFAARGDERHAFPPGEVFDYRHANIEETGIGKSCAVGLFPNGASPFGAEDMSGNVWEWTLNNAEDDHDTRIDSGAARNMRGGAFSYSTNYATTTRTLMNDPWARFDTCGFRVVRVRGAD